MSRTLQTLARGEISGLALCGTYPPGVDEEFYATLARSKGKAFLLLDSYREIAATLATGQVDILKVNAHELRSLAGRSRGRHRPVAAEGAESIPEMAFSVFAAHQLRWLAVTAGPHTAWLFESPCVGSAPCQPCTWRFYEFHLPAVEGVVNPIGAGDTVGAIFLAQLSAGRRRIRPSPADWQQGAPPAGSWAVPTSRSTTCTTFWRRSRSRAARVGGRTAIRFDVVL